MAAKATRAVLLPVQFASWAKGSGAEDLATYFVGQVVGTMNTVKPSRRVVLEMMEEFIDAVQRLDGFLEDE